MNNEEVRIVVEDLQKRLPGWKVSWGYIGNIEHNPFSDNRSWSIDLRPESIMTIWKSDDCYHVGATSWDGTSKSEIVFNLDLDHFNAFVERQKIKYAEHMKSYFNQINGDTELKVLLHMFHRNGIDYQDMAFYPTKHIRARIYKRGMYGNLDLDRFADIAFDFDSLGNCININKDNC